MPELLDCPGIPSFFPAKLRERNPDFGRLLEDTRNDARREFARRLDELQDSR